MELKHGNLKNVRWEFYGQRDGESNVWSNVVRAMFGVQLKGTKIAMDLMLMMGLNETIDQMAMAISVC